MTYSEIMWLYYYGGAMNQITKEEVVVRIETLKTQEDIDWVISAIKFMGGDTDLEILLLRKIDQVGKEIKYH